LIVDEIDVNIHPRAQEKFIEYFINKNEKGNAQLFFSTHSLNFMNKLSNDQIFLVEKNKDSQSKVLKLNKFAIRTGENVLAKYMSGVYGGFPKIKI
jgi:AAA15 family ATPase/GTPase